MKLVELEELYLCCRNVNDNGFNIILVNDPLIKEFYKALIKYTNTIKLIDANQTFRRFCSVCWDIYREISCSPISPKMAFYYRKNILEELHPKLSSQLSNKNQLSNETKQIIDLLKKIKKEELSTLLIKLSEVSDKNHENVVTVSNLFSKRKNEILESLQCGIPVLSADSLVEVSNLRKRQTIAFSKLYNFGMPRVYDRGGLTFLLRSPVSQEIIFIAYSHEKNNEITQNGFDARELKSLIERSSDQSPDVDQNNTEHELPDEYSRTVRFKRRDTFLHDTEENIAAWKVILGDGKTGTYLDPESTHYTLDFKNVEGRFICNSVDETLVEEIDQESLLVFNTHGGGNMLVPVADAIMGSDAARNRKLQEEWKKALGKIIFDTNENTVIWKLRHVGSKAANKINLNNWKSLDSRKIAMKDLEVDFRAVLKVLGLESRYEEFTAAVIAIRDSHRAAGLQLIAQLRNSLINKDISVIFESGYYIAGKELNGPELTIFGVDEINRIEEAVPRSCVGKLFDIEEI